MSDNAYDDSYIVAGDEKRLWKARWSEYNKMYYNPAATYTPWPGQADASPTAPRSNPMEASPTLTLSSEYDSVETGIIVDNTDPGFTRSAVGWSSTTASEDYGSDYLFTNGDNNGSNTWARWTVNVPAAGDYEISGWWRSYDGTRVTDVTYDVVRGGGTDAGVPPGGVNQNVWAHWTSLGTYYFSGGGDEYIQLNATVAGSSKYTADAMKFTPVGGTTISIKNAHYYTYSDSEDAFYLVVLDGSIKYYRFSQDVDDVAEAGLILDTTPPDDVVPKDSDGNTRSYAAELQNFANWFSFYRRRSLTAKAAIARVIDDIEGVKVGFHSIHDRLNQPVLPVNVTTGGSSYDDTTTLLNLLYGLESSGGTPLRDALKNVGEYFDQAGGDGGIGGSSPYASEADGGACQQSFAIVVTDGYWNGYLSGIGNEDLSEGAPYADNWSGTLADVAMKYYKTDLSTGLSDLVPTNYPDLATWQHMVTYGISFGVTGTLNPFDYDLYNINAAQRVYPTWPNPTDTENQERIDDLWHAAVNGRGQFLSAANPENLIDSLQALMENVMSRIGSGASISINGEELQAGSRIYQASYSTDNWTGDVKAYALNQNSGAVLRDSSIWSASDELESLDPGNRIGAAVDAVFTRDLFAQEIGGIIVESAAEPPANWETLGVTTEEFTLTYQGEPYDLSELQEAWEEKLSPVFPYRGAGESVEELAFAADIWAAPAVKCARPRAVIPTFPGTNCELDTARTLERAGAEPVIALINNLTPDHVARSVERIAAQIDDAQMIVFPGGFSGGDEPDGSGKFITAFFRNPRMTAAVNELLKDRDGLILGVCNGFQALIKLGLVPFGRIIEPDADCPTLTFNTVGRHQSMLVRTRIASDNSPWLKGMNIGELHTIPVSHGEGRFVCPDELLQSLINHGQIATQYVDLSGNPTMDMRFNPNGSTYAVEGLLSPDGRVFGKMGHSERSGKNLYKNVDGAKFQPIFENGVAYFR